MCGIIGYVGKKDAYPILLDGLKRLEYRGYDSFGFATVQGSKIWIEKDVGKISEVTETSLPGTIGIAHTRWATHGGVTKANAHPHMDCEGQVAVVHNGIIENFQDLRKELKGKGHDFKSDTDTEIIVHLMEDFLKDNDFEEAFKLTLTRLEGSYAIAAVKRDENKMIAARKGSPLVLGIGNGEYFVASDIPAFLKHTKRVMYLYDGDIAIFDGGLKIWDQKLGKEVERKIDTVGWDVEDAQKTGFKYYMLKEIIEQTNTLKKAMEQNPEIIQELADSIKDANGVFFVACGSSYHACLVASYLFSKIAKRHINVVLASEFPGYEHFLTDKTLVIAVSQSGETADVLEAVNTAKRKKSKIISIVNTEGSSLTRESDHTLLMHSGPEICVLSTKTYTSQLALMLLLAYASADSYKKGIEELNYAWNLAYNLTSRNTRDYVTRLAEKLKDKNHIFTIGRGIQYPTAMEAALKIKEVSYIHAEGFAGGELKHGPIALIEEGTPCIVFVSKDIEKETVSNAMEIKARGGYMIGVGPKNNEVFDYFIKVPEVGNLNPLVQIIPIQILAYKLALLRGLDPDKPKNLAKSVTVK